MKQRILTVILMAVLGLVYLPPQCASTSYRDYVYFLRELVDLDRLCRVEEGVVSGQASSYDRRSRYDEAVDEYIEWDANGDSGNYIRVDEETGEGVMAELTGPGCIHRIWSANPQGKIRFYLDGAEEPTYEFDFNELFSGNIEPFRRPLVWQRRLVLGGENPASDSYLPIPFMHSCKVTADQPHRQYYHIGYSFYPRGVRVKTFELPLTEEENQVLDEVCAKLRNRGWDPQARTLQVEKEMMELQPGREMSLEIREGPAIIRELRAKVTSDEPNINRKVILKAYWDREKTPNIWAPIGDFFGEGFGGGYYRSLPLGVREGSAYSFWRMPFKARAHFVLGNEGRLPALVYLKVGYEALDEWSDDLAYFHGKWRREIDCASFDYPFLHCYGKGRFVGAALFVDNIHGGWWGEGDEKIYLNGEKFPSYFGTGSEDYFGDAWGIRDFQNPYHGCIDASPRQQSCYRWHVSDSIPFRREFKITIENYTANEEVRNDYASMAYWYQLPPEDDFFQPVPVRERLVQPPTPPPGFVEAESLFTDRALPRGASLVSDEDFAYELSGGQGVLLQGKPGDWFFLPLPALSEGIYSLTLNTAPLSNTPHHQIHQGGQPVTDRVRLGEESDTIDIRFQRTERDRGRKGLLIDSLRLVPYKEFIRQWMVIGPWDNPESTGLTTPQPPEGGVDFGQEYTGKDGQSVAWKKAEAEENGIIDLVELLEPDQSTVAYGYVNVVAPEAMKTTLYVGSDDGVRAWVNGQMLIDHQVKRAIEPDQDSAELELSKGDNSLLLKVEQSDGGWAFCARFWDPEERLDYNLEAP